MGTSLTGTATEGWMLELIWAVGVTFLLFMIAGWAL
jgi:hypothetical protein